MSELTAVCPDCGRSKSIDRSDDDPPGAIKMVLQCDRCDDGDRHAPEFYDTAGTWLNPAPERKGS